MQVKNRSQTVRDQTSGSGPDRGAEYCDECVCLSVCLSACLCLSVRDHIFANTRPIFTKFFCACYLFPWLDPLLAAQ